MRFQIKQSWKANAPYRFVLNESTIQVTRGWNLKRLGYYELQWTWLNGKTYTLLHPGYWIIKRRRWHIFLDEQEICTGESTHPSLGDTILRAALAGIEWHCAGQVVTADNGYCRIVWKLPNGRRLAVLRQRCAMEVAYRNQLPDEFVPVLLGMILGSIFGPDTSSGDGD